MNVRNKSDHGLWHTFKDAWVVENGLTA